MARDLRICGTGDDRFAHSEGHPSSGTRSRTKPTERVDYIRVPFKKVGVQNTPLCTLFLHSRLFSQTSGSIFLKREPMRFGGYVMSH